MKTFYTGISGSLDGGRPVPDEYSSVAATVRVGMRASGTYVDVQPDLLLTDARPLGIYLTFDVQKITEPPSIVEPTSASTSSACTFSVLMANANRNLKRLPNELSETDNLRKLKNKFREFLALNNVGWSADCVSKYDTSFINTE